MKEKNRVKKRKKKNAKQRDSKRKKEHETKKTDKEIFYKLLYTSKEEQCYKFIKLSMDFINRFKEKGYSYNDFNFLLGETDNNDLKHQLNFMKYVYVYYNKTIHEKNGIDFNDMINFA